MADTTISTIQTLLKQDLLPVIQREVFQTTPLLDVLKQRGAAAYRKLQNNSFEISVQKSHHSGVYNIGENDSILTGSPSYAKMTISPKYMYGSHLLTHQAMKVAEGGADALAGVVTEFGQAVKDSMGRDLNRQFYGFGEGILTLVNGIQTSATITVDSTENLAEGMSVLVGTKAQIEAGTADSVSVLSVNSATSVTFSGSITVADNDRIVKAGVYSNSAYNEFMGLQGLVDYSGGNTTTFQNITRSTNYWANSYVDVTGEALSVADMTTAILECRTGKPDAAFANKTLVEKYHNLLATNRRIVNTIQLVDGWTGLEIAANGRSIPLVLDFQAPEGEIYFIDSTKFIIGELSPMGWLDEGEGILKWIQGKAAYEAIMTYYAQLMTTHPKAHAALRNKTA